LRRLLCLLMRLHQLLTDSLLLHVTWETNLQSLRCTTQTKIVSAPKNCLQAFPLQALLLHPLLIFSCLETIYRREPLGKALLIWNVSEFTTSS